MDQHTICPDVQSKGFDSSRYPEFVIPHWHPILICVTRHDHSGVMAFAKRTLGALTWLLRGRLQKQFIGYCHMIRMFVHLLFRWTCLLERIWYLCWSSLRSLRWSRDMITSEWVSFLSICYLFGNERLNHLSLAFMGPHQGRPEVTHHQRLNQNSFRFGMGLLYIVRHNSIAVHGKDFDVWTKRHFIIFLDRDHLGWRVKMHFCGNRLNSG
jgi:hypothetical protein